MEDTKNIPFLFTRIFSLNEDQTDLQRTCVRVIKFILLEYKYARTCESELRRF